VPGIGAEIVLTVDGELRKTRLFRPHEQAELVGAIADTRTMFEGKGWARWVCDRWSQTSSGVSIGYWSGKCASTQ
jgi:hypothetical protein